jgi:uncharacterized protein YdcH (DUF465 family)
MSVPRPNFTLRIDLFHHHADPDAIEAAFKTLGDEMAKSFKKLMEEMNKVAEEIKEHETAEDAAAAATAEKLTLAEAKIAELQARIDEGTLSADQEAEAVAAIAKLRSDAGLPEPTPGGEDGGGVEIEPEPTPPEGGGGDVEVEE